MLRPQALLQLSSWSNTLFEDNAEFGLGFRVAIDKQMEYAQELLQIKNNELHN